jgi:hypothetical protein
MIQRCTPILCFFLLFFSFSFFFFSFFSFFFPFFFFRLSSSRQNFASVREGRREGEGGGLLVVGQVDAGVKFLLCFYFHIFFFVCLLGGFHEVTTVQWRGRC